MSVARLFTIAVLVVLATRAAHAEDEAEKPWTEFELGGTIDWHTVMGTGTEVTIEVPLRWITAD